MSPVEKEDFGKTSTGKHIERFTLKNSNGMVVKVLSYGCIVTEIHVPDRRGKLLDVVTGYDTLKEWEADKNYFGAVVGRVANRIANARFTLDGETYTLAANQPPNSLHGGIKGFNQKVWDASIDGDSLKLVYVSQDGEEGYPGQLTSTVTYKVTDDNELQMCYEAVTSKPTPVNLTNHCYFNLGGHKQENVYDHKMTILSDQFTPKTETGVPTGEVASVKGTVFDIRAGIMLGDKIDDVPIYPSDNPGYDHNYCLENEGKKQLIAKVEHEASGIEMEVFTDQPGVQLYTANHLNGVKGKDGASYGKHCSFCLETQAYPDAVNHKNFPSCILKPKKKKVPTATLR